MWLVSWDYERIVQNQDKGSRLKVHASGLRLQVGTCRASTWRRGGIAAERGQPDYTKTRSGGRKKESLFWEIKKSKRCTAPAFTVSVSLLNLFADVRWNNEVNILRTPCPADATSLQGRAKSSSWSGTSIWYELIAGSCVFQCSGLSSPPIDRGPKHPCCSRWWTSNSWERLADYSKWLTNRAHKSNAKQCRAWVWTGVCLH